MKEFEKRGVATVALVSDDFIDDHRRTAESFGIPGLPYARLAAPLVSQTPEQVRDLVDGAVDAVLVALTTVPDAGGQSSAVRLRTDPSFTFEGADWLEAFQEMNERMLEWQYSDALPRVRSWTRCWLGRPARPMTLSACSSPASGWRRWRRLPSTRCWRAASRLSCPSSSPRSSACPTPRWICGKRRSPPGRRRP